MIGDLFSANLIPLITPLLLLLILIPVYHAEIVSSEENPTNGTVFETPNTLPTSPVSPSKSKIMQETKDMLSGRLGSLQNGSREVENMVNSSKIYMYPPLTFDTPEDKKTQEEWGGNCTLSYWDRCKVIKEWFGYYFIKNGTTMQLKHHELDCILEPVLCMKNGWSVNRCHVLCMSQCNKEMQYSYEKYVSHEGECKAHNG